MLYLEKLNHLTKEKRFGIAVAAKIIRGEATEEEVSRVEYLRDNLNDIICDFEIDSDSCGPDSWQSITSDFSEFLDFITEEKITQKEFQLMKLL